MRALLGPRIQAIRELFRFHALPLEPKHTMEPVDEGNKPDTLSVKFSPIGNPNYDCEATQGVPAMANTISPLATSTILYGNAYINQYQQYAQSGTGTAVSPLQCINTSPNTRTGVLGGQFMPYDPFADYAAVGSPHVPFFPAPEFSDEEIERAERIMEELGA